MTPDRETLLRAKAATQSIYDRYAAHWHGRRSRALYEQVWLDRLISALKPGGRILDLGCGSGDPVAGYLLKKGFDLTGLDYAPAMIEIARSIYPEAHWRIGDMRALPDLGFFDGVYSWDGFFHLSVEEQREVLPKLADSVAQDGALLLTVGTGEGEVTGTVAGETVYHASLAPDEYERVLRQCGFENVFYKAEDPDCQGRSVLLAAGRMRPPL